MSNKITDHPVTPSKPVNAFSPDYVSQVVPFKANRSKALPRLCQPTYNIYQNIASPEEGKRAKLLKAAI